jgi:hypothetical protein
MRNHDEALLRSQQLNPALPFPLAHQAVRIALYDEYAARAFYVRVLEAFGPRPPFINIVRSEAQHIAALLNLCERFGIPRPLDPFVQETTVEATWLANCQRAVLGESANIQLYTYLLAHVAEPEIRRVFENLRAASSQQHLPAFAQAVLAAQAQEKYHAARGIPAQQAYVRHGPLSDLLERLFAHWSAQAVPLGWFSPLLRHAPPAMLAGIAVGGAGVYLLRNSIGHHHQEEN